MKALRGNPIGVRMLLGILALLLAVGAAMTGFGAPALAAAAVPGADPTPSPSEATSTQSIGLWVRVSADKSNVAGVKIDVTGPKGFMASAVSGADGRATIPVPGSGAYKVMVNTTSIPAEKGTLLGLNPREVQVDTGNTGVPAYFLIGDALGAGATPAPGTTNSPSSGSKSGSQTSFIDKILPRVATGLIFGLLLALASIGVSLIYGTTGLSNFAHGELVTFGSLTGYLIAGPLHLPGWVGIIMAMVLGGVFGFVQDLGIWKPLRKRNVPLIPLMIVSIGLSLALRYLFQFIFGPGLLVTPSNSKAVLTLGPVPLRFTDITTPIICLMVLLFVAFALLRTRIGKATRAVSDNRSLAAATGINVERVIRIVWVAGGALAGLSGALLGYYQPVSWQSGASILLLIFAAVTLGGFGTAFGALVGSLIISLVVDVSTIIIPSNLKLVAALAVMIVVLIFRPQGILGRKDRVG
jgi:branched-subunit amino acid ABC-type transport system permease component